MTTWAVLGPGGVGGLVAAALTRAGDGVVVLAREQTAGVLAADGLRVRSTSLGTFTAHPAAAPVLEEPADVLVIAVKAGALDAALERVRAPVGVVLPLLNGFEHVARLRERFEHVLAASIRVESARVEPGVIVHASPGVRLELSGRPDLATRLSLAGLETRVVEDEATLLWSKLCRLCPLALTTAASGRTLGEIREDPGWAERLWSAVDECVAVARAEGAHLDPDTTRAELRDAHPGLTSSLARDVAAGHPGELDAIGGAVLRAAARHDLPAPAVTELTTTVATRHA